MEDKPIFKFKKTNTKLVGEINVLSTDLYDYLEGRGFANEIKFLHIRKMWNIIETADKLVENKPEFHIVRGFFKEGKLVAEKTNIIKSNNIQGILEKYSGFLRECINQGWKKDQSMYEYYYNSTGNLISSPTYHMVSNNSSDSLGFDLRSYSGDAKLHMPAEGKSQAQIEEEVFKWATENTRLTQLNTQKSKSNTNILQRILKTIKIK
jgi:hypothetical protein